MIVTQSRHIWALSKLASFFNDQKFTDYAFHGFKFLNQKMWDKIFGGFFNIRSRDGEQTDFNNYFDEKRTYGNAFAIYGLSALYEITHDPNVLELAKQTYKWIEEKSFDKKNNGYFQFLTREGKPFNLHSDYKSKAVDKNEVGFKDQNSSIHLLEAYTELYKNWKSDELKNSLENILIVIRDSMIDSKGYLRLFFNDELKPYSAEKINSEITAEEFALDHISFGHNYETSYLMLEASFTLGIENDIRTLQIAKKMLDHAIKYGWDYHAGGFFDAGFYFENENQYRIIKQTKVWWAQAEALNVLLLFSYIFREEKIYEELFYEQWEYIKRYLIDYKFGDWYWGSLEKEPFYKYEPKANIWKCTYHTGRALMNCIKMLSLESKNKLIDTVLFDEELEKISHFINHWRLVSKII
ncbi:MAG: cellobiose 2-epimerase [Ignavibacteriales bacterium]